MQNYYQFIIARLNGEEIRKRYPYYRSLVKKGIAGFIIFGGELETVRKYIAKLQAESDLPLIISSDLERGLGQQLKGGTLLPPAMALAAAYRREASARSQQSAINLLRSSFRAVAIEAKYAGINTIFAPVLDINTNPKNPIIGIRSFGPDKNMVSLLGSEMIKVLEKNGIAACGKHFPGHGDTEVDSHIKLPIVKHTLRRLKNCELKPFKNAISAGVSMIMMGHLKVPYIDSSGMPVSLSEKAVRFIRDDMGFNGILITDAMNMGGIGRYSEEEASALALKAGVDILLHPSNPHKTAKYLRSKNIACDEERLRRFRSGLLRMPDAAVPRWDKHKAISQNLVKLSIVMSGSFRMSGNPLLIILNDDAAQRGKEFIEGLRIKYPDMRVCCRNRDLRGRMPSKKENESLIVAVFSETKAWKGGTSSWLLNNISAVKNQADLFVSFGSPYLFDTVNNVPRMFVYWDSVSAQQAAAYLIAWT